MGSIESGRMGETVTGGYEEGRGAAWQLVEQAGGAGAPGRGTWQEPVDRAGTEGLGVTRCERVWRGSSAWTMRDRAARKTSIPHCVMPMPG